MIGTFGAPNSLPSPSEVQKDGADVFSLRAKCRLELGHGERPIARKGWLAGMPLKETIAKASWRRCRHRSRGNRVVQTGDIS